MPHLGLDDPDVRAAYYREHGFWTDQRLGWAIGDAASRWPDREFLVIGDDRLTFAEFARWVDVLAADMVESGLSPGDRALIQLPNRVEALVAQAAAFRAGIVSVPIVPIYRRHEMHHIIGDCRPRAIFSVESQKDRKPSQEIDQILDELSLDVPARYCVGGGGSSSWKAMPGRDDDPAPVDLHVPLPADATAVMLYTSGTTSAPKGVKLSQRAVVSNAREIQVTMNLSQDDVFFACSPLSHLAGFVVGVVWPICIGAKVVVMPAWDAKEAAVVIDREKATFTTGAAVFLHDLVAAYRRMDWIEHRLTTFMSGGASTPPSLVRAAEEVGMRAVRGYGMTETGGGVSWMAPSEDLELRANCDGRVIKGTEMQAVDAARQPLPAGEEGELRVRSPQQLLAYTDPEATARAIDADGWLYTGDIGSVTSDGLVRISGRTKDIINRGGEKFSARDIEEQVLDAPGIASVAVVGRPDERLGEEVAAFVTLEPGADWDGPDGIVAHLRERGVAKQKTPREWIVLEELPRTASGKIQKHKLLEHFTD